MSTQEAPMRTLRDVLNTDLEAFTEARVHAVKLSAFLCTLRGDGSVLRDDSEEAAKLCEAIGAWLNSIPVVE